MGAIVAICGILVYMELGLTLPLYAFDHEGDVSVPRNGGELNYVSHALQLLHEQMLIIRSSNISSRSHDTLRFVCSEWHLSSLQT